MPVANLTIYLHIPGCDSLKEKRGFVKSILTRVSRELNIACSEMGEHDRWQEAVLGFVTISNDALICRSVLQKAVEFIEKNYPDVEIFDHKIEML
jgi:uncharacterized protein YlxP (DUF503 family)